MVSWLIGATGQLLTPHSFRSRPISLEEPIEGRPLERARRPVDSALVDTQIDLVAEPAEDRAVAERDVLEREDGVVGAVLEEDARPGVAGRDGLLLVDDEAGRPAHHRREEAGIREADRQRVACTVRIADERLARVVHPHPPVYLAVGLLEEIEIGSVLPDEQIPRRVGGTRDEEERIAARRLLPIGADEQLVLAPRTMEHGHERVRACAVYGIGEEQIAERSLVRDRDERAGSG